MTRPSPSCVRAIEDHRGTCPRRKNRASGVRGQCESGTHPRQPLHINTEVAKHLLEERVEIVPARQSETRCPLHTHTQPTNAAHRPYWDVLLGCQRGRTELCLKLAWYEETASKRKRTPFGITSADVMMSFPGSAAPRTLATHAGRKG
jgi:hypothetical protein